MTADKYDTPILTVTETAAYLRVSRSTVYRLLRRGTIPAFRVGGDWRFRKRELDAWLNLLARGELKALT